MKRQLLIWVAGGMVLALGSVVIPGVALAQSSVMSVPPPQVYDYWVSITRQSGGTLVFDGYAPSEAARERFSEIAGADTNWLKLGSGAPATYEAAVAFGVKVLEGLSEGRFAVRGNIVSISGTAASSDAYAATRELLSAVPAGLILAMGEVAAPRVTPYDFSVTRQADGSVTLSGHVPGPEMARALVEAAGEGAKSTLTYGSGQPFTFETGARQAVALLPLIAEGSIRLEGEKWTIAATPASPEAAQAIEREFAEHRLPEAGWSLSLAAPRATAAREEIAAPPDNAVAAAQEPAAPDPVASEAPPTVAQATPESRAAEPPATPANAADEVTPAVSVTAQPAGQGLEQCRSELAALSARNAILFRSGAAILAPEGLPTLDAIAATLARCPQAAINIEGHTDSDGDASLNMALSVARADAVANALVERGVAAERLYVLGFGEAQPIADNATAVGKAQNRRIVVSVRENAPG